MEMVQADRQVDGSQFSGEPDLPGEVWEHISSSSRSFIAQPRRRMPLSQFLDHVQHFLLGADALAFQDLQQGRHFPHAGDGQLLYGHDLFRVE